MEKRRRGAMAAAKNKHQPQQAQPTPTASHLALLPRVPSGDLATFVLHEERYQGTDVPPLPAARMDSMPARPPAPCVPLSHSGLQPRCLPRREAEREGPKQEGGQKERNGRKEESERLIIPET